MKYNNLVIIVVLSNWFVPVSHASITTTQYYDGRKMAVMWTSDDMHDQYGTNHVHWARFLDAAYLCQSNHMVFTPGVIVGKMRNSGSKEANSAWAEFQRGMDEGWMFPVSHSWSHPLIMPTNETAYVQEFEDPFDFLVQKLEYPVWRRYKGKEYPLFFIQFGGIVHPDYSRMLEHIKNMNILGVRYYSVSGEGSTEWSHWNPEHGLFGKYIGEVPWLLASIRESHVFDGSWKSRFDMAYSNSLPFISYDHTYQDDCWVKGTNSQLYTEMMQYIGNRHDVWYTTPGDFLEYKLEQAVYPPAITITISNATEIAFRVDGDPKKREKWAMSYPLTFKVDKLSGWSGKALKVFVKEEGVWHTLEVRTTNDWFNSGNCWRDAEDAVYVSQALPEWSDSCEIFLGIDSDSFPKTPLAYYSDWLALYPSLGLMTNQFDDADGDQVNNLVEYALGGNPTNSLSSYLLSEHNFERVDGNNYFEYIHVRRKDFVALGLVYTVERSANLVTDSWTTNGIEVVGVGVFDENFEIVTNRIPVNNDYQFIRLRIESNQ